jgi:hypothetical protein
VSELKNRWNSLQSNPPAADFSLLQGSSIKDDTGKTAQIVIEDILYA